VVDIAGGNRNVLELCLSLVRPGGTLVLFGLYGDPGITLHGYPMNDIIFRKLEFEHLYAGKNIYVHGMTGREGVWPYLIDTVAGSAELQRKIMQLVTVMGPMERLGPDTGAFDTHKIIKRAYTAFS
jgi:threonine dehydrogenase-like Zn-dependent dehydrogenase